MPPAPIPLWLGMRRICGWLVIPNVANVAVVALLLLLLLEL